MQLKKKIYLFFILILFIGFIHTGIQVEWSMVFNEEFKFEMIQGFLVISYILFVLIFQYYQNYFKNKSKD